MTDQLEADIARAKDLCFKFNHTLPSDEKTREAILAELLPHKGSGVFITYPFYCDYGYNIYMGANVFINYEMVILDCEKVTIGNNVMIGPQCTITAVGHPLDEEQRISGVEVAKEIVIEDDVWIGAGVTIVSGVHIGKGSVIGAGSIVTKDIPAHVVAFGNPCRVYREITQEDKLDLEALENNPC